MRPQEPLAVAQHVVAEHFPDALAAFLAGSALTSRRTPTSDLDIVVVLAGTPAPYRETLRVDGWVVELFVQTPTSLTRYWNLEAASWRVPLTRMCAEGHVLATSGDAAADYQAEARSRLAIGPLVSAEKLMYRRYVLTDLLDDLRGSTDSTELSYISSSILNSASELVLLSESHWLGSGKWLARHLAEINADLGERLVKAQQALISVGDKIPLERAIIEVLDRVGGPLLEGYRADGEDPDRK